ncbi:MAG: FtsQ-type POTRA domain-containing protein [Rhodospirillales bacterium]|nr:FtsQ-type POTRA domain-containing protein [Rhodospirillales bacterium]
MRFLNLDRLLGLSKMAATKKGQRRKRVVPWWRTRTSRLGLPALALLVTFGGVWILVQSGWPGRVADRMVQSTVASTVDAGLSVRQVLIVGRKETSSQTILDALDIRRGSPILAIDLEAARARVAALPWIQSASVERMMPDLVFVRVTERRPLALWQNKGEFALVDEEGAMIDDHNVSRFPGLIVVVGVDAPHHAAELIATLKRHPTLMERVNAAVRVGGRRWNLRFSGGIDVLLPEEGADAAWERLAGYQTKYDVLGRNIRELDLRLPNQVNIRQAQPRSKPVREGRDT